MLRLKCKDIKSVCQIARILQLTHCTAVEICNSFVKRLAITLS